MTTPAGLSQGENVYYLDTENTAEMGCLLNLDQVFTKGMGLFPNLSDSEIASLRRVLDVSCGPGGWAQEVAFTYPDIEVVGFDISQIMIDYAKAQAHVQGLDNLTFHVMDIQEPLKFPDSSFDLVNARFVNFLPAAAWPQLMQEYRRIARPGGFITLTESEWWYFTNSPALEKFNSMIIRSIKMRGSFSESGMFTGVLPLLGRFLLDIGCVDVQHTAHVIDFSAGTLAHDTFRQDAMVAFKLFQPRMVSMGVATQDELNENYDRMLVDMAKEDFRGLMMPLTVTGKMGEK
jgi:SAM-dependent methyltransferase